MKYIKKFEGVWSKNVIIGGIYKISPHLLPEKGWNHTIDLCEVIDIEYLYKSTEINYINIKTYIKETNEEFFMNYANKKILIRKATKDEEIKFKTIQDIKKYNL